MPVSTRMGIKEDEDNEEDESDVEV